MRPREKSTDPRQSPKMNTSPTLKLFVYGTLKRGYRNHDDFCEGVPEIREGQVRGRLYDGSGFPVLEPLISIAAGFELTEAPGFHWHPLK